jgi:hypothetical protein
MPFCGKCGSQVKDGAGFCESCGGALRAGTTPAVPAGTTPVKSASALKFILIVVGALFVMGFLAFAVVGYVGYKAVKTVQKSAEEHGVDLTALSGQAEKGRRFDPCSLLTSQEAAEILNRTVARTERQGDSCDYYIKPQTEEERRAEVERNMETVSTTKQADSKEVDRDPNAAMRNQGMEELMKSITGGVNDGSTPYLRVEVHEDGKLLINANKVAIGLGGGANMIEALKGVADEAILGPVDSMLVMVKRGTGVMIDLRQVPKGRERGIEMAKKIAARM